MTTMEAAAFLDRVRRFAADALAPAAPNWAMGAQPNPELFVAAAAQGLMGIEVPASAGGQALPFAVKAKACEILAAVDFGFAMSVVNTHNVAKRLCLSASPAIVERVVPQLLSGRASACTALTEPGAGSDLARIATRAERTADGWSLTGEKSWIVNGRHAGFAIVFAQCHEPGDMAGIATFLVDLNAQGVERYAQDSPLPQTSIGSGGFRLNSVALPADSLVQPAGEALRAILQEINGARAYVAAMCCGMLSAALDEVTAYGEERRTFGKVLADHQAWRGTLARAQTDLAAAAALTAQAVAHVSSGDDAQLVAAEAKIFAVDACQRHLPMLLHAMGAAGLDPRSCVVRHLTAAPIAALTDGANSLLTDRVARLTRPQPKQA